MHKLEQCGYLVVGYSLTDVSKLPSLLLTKDLVVSSNLRSNMFILGLRDKISVIIFNGLGRNRGKAWFRRWLFLMVKLRKNNVYILQNYADYRYFRRFHKQINLVWICGSGGKEKPFARKENDVVGVVSRVSKLPLQERSIGKFEMAISKQLEFVGVDHAGSLGSRRCHGYLNSNEILSHFNTLFLPDGYGEGFPHVACDALTSGMACWLSKTNFVQYGCSKMDVEIVDRMEDFICIKSSKIGDESQFSEFNILVKYIKTFTQNLPKAAETK